MTAEAASVCVVTTTCASEEDAARFARVLLDAHLAACVQIAPIRSLYVWGGELQDARESLLLIKAKLADWPALEASIRAAHSYEIPEILAFTAAAGHIPYLQWILAASEPPPEKN